MDAQNKFTIFSIALFAYLCTMAIRHIYLAYFKYPKLVDHYRQLGDETNASYWEQWIKKCKDNLIWRYVLMAMASAMALGAYQLGEFFIKASQP